jgi:DNA-binding transcriptional MocR family regulator
VTGRSAREIAESVERGIGRGGLRPGQRLPPIRTLAGDLGTSPATVAAAYRSLRERGLVVAGGRRGTVVSHRPPLPVSTMVPVPPGVRDLRAGLPDQRLLPDLGPALASAHAPGVASGRHEERNDQRLLALAGERLRRDGIDPSHMAVVGGALDGVERVLAARVSRGDLVAVEDPSYPPVLDLLAAMGASPLPIQVDEEGLRPAALREALARRPKALVVVPRAQNPTGAALTASRAEELRALLAEREELLVIEDDHAHEIAGSACHTLTDRRRERWAVIRSAAKTLNPDLRLAVLAGDATTVRRVEGRQVLGTGWVSTILQRTVAALWSDPRTDALVARARQAYAARRRALVAALAERGIPARGRTGLNVWVPVREEAVAVEALLAGGWAVRAGERFRLRTGPGIRVTIATLQPDEAPALADAIAATQRTSRRARPY